MKKCLYYLFFIIILFWNVVFCLHLPKCEKIATPICQHLGYNMTLMPNFAGHNSQVEASRGLQAFQPLLHYNCSRHLRLFVCSVFVPLCSEHVPGAVPACKNLCETVRKDCQPVLDQFLLPWPPELECNRFPASPALCMNHPTVTYQATQNGGNFNQQQILKDSTVKSTSSAIIGGEGFNRILSWGGSDGSSSNNKVNLSEVKTFSNCPPRFKQVDDVCTPLCGEDAYYRSEDKSYIKTWTLVWSSICCTITSFTLLTFWLDQNRFKYPERPLLFMTLNCFLYSSIILIRTVISSEGIICVSDYLVTKSSDNTLCASSAFVLHILELGSRMWWMIFCVCWYLHASHEWSNESLTSASSVFHAIVLITSGIPALLALTTGHYNSDELTGSCCIKEESSIWFIVTPHILSLITGAIFAIGTSVALIKVKISLKESGRCIKKLKQLMIRLVIFTILFLIPEMIFLICTMYESWHRPWWKSLALLSALDCRSCSHEPVYHNASLQAVLLRIFSNLMIVLCCLMWVCSGKTWRTWVQVCESPTKNTAHKRPTIIIVRV